MCITVSDEIDDKYIGIYKDISNTLVCVEKDDIGVKKLAVGESKTKNSCLTMFYYPLIIFLLYF